MIHIHNGDVSAELAKRAGIPGEHLPFRESLVSGPARPGAEWIAQRARHLAATHHEEVLRVSNSLFEQEQALAAAATSDEEVVLWFEHDLFCLVHFVHVLQRFTRPNVTAVWCSDPIGTTNEENVVRLFESRRAVTPSMTRIAHDVWAAYTAADPTGLNRWLERDTPDFPFLREGLTLHAARFPSVRNGLGIVENRLLELIASGATDFATLFPRFDPDPPRLGFGDTEVLRHLRAMAQRAVPLILMTEEETGPPPKVLLAVTPAGENVWAGSVDDVKVNDPDLWLGGAHVTKETLWRWDDDRRQIIPSRPAGF